MKTNNKVSGFAPQYTYPPSGSPPPPNGNFVPLVNSSVEIDYNSMLTVEAVYNTPSFRGDVGGPPVTFQRLELMKTSDYPQYRQIAYGLGAEAIYTRVSTDGTASSWGPWSLLGNPLRAIWTGQLALEMREVRNINNLLYGGLVALDRYKILGFNIKITAVNHLVFLVTPTVLGIPSEGMIIRATDQGISRIQVTLNFVPGEGVSIVLINHTSTPQIMATLSTIYGLQM